MIKVIDLLNIIAKGENKIPTKIKYYNSIYEYNGIDYIRREEDEYEEVYIIHLMDRVALTPNYLNKEVEIISYE